jgi:hypothetical protein
MKNHLKKICIYFCFLLNLLCLSSANLKKDMLQIAPEDPLTGLWKGYLTQKAGGFASKYDFEINFVLKNDNRITGESSINMPNGTFSIITLIGEKLNKKIVVKELSIRKQKIEGGSWCIKNYTLMLKNNTLKGSWFGCVANSNAPEGEIYLERK